MYIWRRGDVVQYVGMSRRGLRRPLWHCDLKPTDTIEILSFPGLTAAEVRAHEVRVIAELKPLLNRHHTIRCSAFKGQGAYIPVK